MGGSENLCVSPRNLAIWKWMKLPVIRSFYSFSSMFLCVLCSLIIYPDRKPQLHQQEHYPLIELINWYYSQVTTKIFQVHRNEINMTETISNWNEVAMDFREFYNHRTQSPISCCERKFSLLKPRGDHSSRARQAWWNISRAELPLSWRARVKNARPKGKVFVSDKCLDHVHLNIVVRQKTLKQLIFCTNLLFESLAYFSVTKACCAIQQSS